MGQGKGKSMSHDHEGHGHEGCGGGHGQEHGHHHDAVAGPGDQLVTCVVKGNKTVKSEAENSGLVRDFRGHRYYFCCLRCLDIFDADPVTFVIAG